MPPTNTTTYPTLSLANIENASQVIDPVFLNTPQFRSDILSRILGMDLVLKVETVNPIRSFKGRGSEYFMSRQMDGPKTLVCASAGNFGQGLAYAARKRGLHTIVFAAESANTLKVERMRELGGEVRLVGSDFDVAKEHAREFAEQTGVQFVEDGRDPEIAEGAGTIAVELCRWANRFDALLVPLGDGALVAGIGCWMKAHSPSTRILGVCAAGAPALARSWQEGKLCTAKSVSTIADGIAVRVPVPESLRHLEGRIDEILLVEDNAMIEAMRLVLRHHGLVTEPAGVAGLAAAITHHERFRDAGGYAPVRWKCDCRANAALVQRGTLNQSKELPILPFICALSKIRFVLVQTPEELTGQGLNFVARLADLR
jgi:threonine dehydratase